MDSGCEHLASDSRVASSGAAVGVPFRGVLVVVGGGVGCCSLMCNFKFFVIGFVFVSV